MISGTVFKSCFFRNSTCATFSAWSPYAEQNGDHHREARCQPNKEVAALEPKAVRSKPGLWEVVLNWKWENVGPSYHLSLLLWPYNISGPYFPCLKNKLVCMIVKECPTPWKPSLGQSDLISPTQPLFPVNSLGGVDYSALWLAVKRSSPPWELCTALSGGGSGTQY